MSDTSNRDAPFRLTAPTLQQVHPQKDQPQAELTENDPIASALLRFREAALNVADWRKRMADARSELEAVREKIVAAEDALGTAHLELSKASNELGAAVTGGLFEARSAFL